MDNLSQQAEEMEVLNSIFEEQWKFNDETDSYTIQIAKDIELWITLNKDYPSDRPPKYELWAPNLSRIQKDLIDKSFQEIYEVNQGCPVIYQWIDKLKEIAVDNTVKETNKDEEEDEFVTENLLNQLTDFDIVNKNKKTIISINLDITHGKTITDRRSTFQGHTCKVTTPEQVQQLLEELYENKKIAQATHNISAYRIITEKNTILQDCDDDGEAHAGGRLLHLLEILDLKNVAVVVSRWYGGIHLGPDRFKHINNAARQVLLDAAFIK